MSEQRFNPEGFYFSYNLIIRMEEEPLEAGSPSGVGFGSPWLAFRDISE